jgi:hypothetical protein
VSAKFDLAPEFELAQVLLGPLAECLGFLRCVDPNKSDSEEFVAGQECFHGIAIGYADNSSLAETIASWPRTVLAKNKATNVASAGPGA